MRDIFPITPFKIKPKMNKKLSEVINKSGLIDKISSKISKLNPQCFKQEILFKGSANNNHRNSNVSRNSDRSKSDQIAENFVTKKLKLVVSNNPKNLITNNTRQQTFND